MRRVWTLLLFVHSSLLFAAASSSSAAGSELEHREPLIGCAKSGAPALDASKLLRVDTRAPKDAERHYRIMAREIEGGAFVGLVATEALETADAFKKAFAKADLPTSYYKNPHEFLDNLTNVWADNIPVEYLKRDEVENLKASILLFKLKQRWKNGECMFVSGNYGSGHYSQKYAVRKTSKGWSVITKSTGADQKNTFFALPTYGVTSQNLHYGVGLVLGSLAAQSLYRRGAFKDLFEKLTLKQGFQAVAVIDWGVWRRYCADRAAYESKLSGPGCVDACVVQ